MKSRLRRSWSAGVLLLLGVTVSCGQPSPAEILEMVSGERPLIRAGGNPLPFVETRAGVTLEMLAGSLRLNPEPAGNSRYTCSFSLTYRETRDDGTTAEGSETVPCTYFRLLNTGIYFELGAGGERIRRLENAPQMCAVCVSGSLFDRDVVIRDRYGVDFIFRK
jgi:hypothetical protein